MTRDRLLSIILLLVFALLTALILAYIFTPMAMWLGRVLGIVDHPGGRRQHEKPTPRSGGLALFGAVCLTLAIFHVLLGEYGRFLGMVGSSNLYRWMESIFLAGAMLMAIGLVDDRWEIKPSIKLLGQIAVGLTAWSTGLHLDKMLGVDLPLWIDMGATVFLYVAAMNAYNLIDGMDGVAGGLGAITGVGLCGLNILLGNPEMAAISLVLSGACLGFLRYNFHPARIFLGDSGSMFIGFMLISLALGADSRSAAVVMLIVPLLTMGVPMIDTGLAIWRRSVRRAMEPHQKTGVSSADRDHLHHRLARRGLTQRRVALLLYSIQAAVFLIGLMWVFFRSYRTAIFAVAFFAGSYVVLRYLASLEMTDSGRWIVDGIRRPGKMQLYSSAMPVMDAAVLSGALLIFYWLLHDLFPSLAFDRLVREVAAPVIGGPLILIWATRYYQPQWTRARPLDFFYLSLISTSGVIIGMALSPLVREFSFRELLLFIVIMLGLSIPLLISIRVFPRVVQDLLHFHERRRSDSEGERVLVYGAGYGFTLITRAESFEISHKRRKYEIVGLLDDDPYLKGRMVHGHQVLGSLNDLKSLVKKHQIDEILVSTDLNPTHEQSLLSLAESLDLKVRQSLFSNRILRDRIQADAKKAVVQTP